MISNTLVSDADLSKLLQDNYHSIASRNTEGKTPRDVALDAELQENVDQIGISPCLTISQRNRLQFSSLDNYCVQLLQDGNTKAITDLILCGYTELTNQLKANDDNSEETNTFINTEIAQLVVRISFSIDSI